LTGRAVSDAGTRRDSLTGPLYVLNGCCTACDVPVSEAPDIFADDDTNHCYVKRRPCAKGEIDRTLRAAWAAELECIRYRGRDVEFLRRFAEFGSPHLCDVPPPPDIRRCSALWSRLAPILPSSLVCQHSISLSYTSSIVSIGTFDVHENGRAFSGKTPSRANASGSNG
jgi:hypothetical protein